MRRGGALRALLTGVVAGLATAPAWLVWGPASPAVAAPCTGPSGIEVVVEYDALGRTTARDCAAPGGDRTAAALFERTGHPQVQVQRYPGAVCRVDGLPGATGARGTNCVDMPPAHNYWALFWSNGSGGWVYSQLGAYSLEVPEGGKVAWVWQDSGARNTPDTTSQRVQAQPSPQPSPSPAPGGNTGNGGGDRDGAGAGGSGTDSGDGADSGGTDSGTDPSAGAGDDAEGSAAGPGTGSGGRGAGGSGRDRERSGPSDRGAKTDRQDREGGRDERDGLGGRDATAQSYDDRATSAPAADPASGDSGGLPPWLPLGVVCALLVIAAAVAVVRARRSG